MSAFACQTPPLCVNLVFFLFSSRQVTLRSHTHTHTHAPYPHPHLLIPHTTFSCVKKNHQIQLRNNTSNKPPKPHQNSSKRGYSSFSAFFSLFPFLFLFLFLAGTVKSGVPKRKEKRREGRKKHQLSPLPSRRALPAFLSPARLCPLSKKRFESNASSFPRCSSSVVRVGTAQQTGGRRSRARSRGVVGWAGQPNSWFLPSLSWALVLRLHGI